MSGWNAVQGNVTASAYSAYSLCNSVAGILGLLLFSIFLYVILFQRDFLSTLLLGYAVLFVMAVVSAIVYVLVTSLPAIIGFMWGIFTFTGKTVIRIPLKVKVVGVVSVPVAYWVGKQTQKHLDKEGND